MAVFAYKAFDTDSSEIHGTIVADTPYQARNLLRDRNLTIQQVTVVTSKTGQKWGLLGKGRVKPHRIASFVRELSTLLGVGIPLLEAIDTLVKQNRGRFRTNLLMLRDRVATGVSLAEAMRQQPHVFDEFCTIITEVGEDTGTLDSTLEELAEFRERTQQLKGRIGTAILYPCIVLITGIAVSVFLMTYVVPNLLESLIEAGKPLPLPTRIVKAVSDFLVNYPLPLLVTIGGGIIMVLWALRTKKGQWLWHRLLLRIPLLGELIRKQAIARIAVIISTLMKSGLVFLRGVQIAQRATKNRVLQDALGKCEAAVVAGQDISLSLEKTGAFPPLVIQIFSVGQHSGRLEEMLDRLATDYDRQVATVANRLTSVLEPILIILLAIVVGFVAFATILPLLEAGNVF